MAWASDWLKRYGNEGITGLKDRAKSGRRPELPEEIRVQDKDHPHGKQSGLDDKAN